MTTPIQPRLLRTVVGLVLATILAGCASRPQWPDTTLNTAGADQRKVLDHVPFHAQELYQCGPASLAMMLNSQGLNTNPTVLKELVYLPARQGSLKVEMVSAARSHGLLVYPLDGSLKSLLEEIASGHPVLVMQNLRFDWWPQWHFAVVIGYDANDRTIILHTGTQERHEQALDVFMATWNRADNWATVILPPDQLPATAQPLRYLTSANDLETTGRTIAATIAYRTAEQAWPDQPAAIMGQGNIAWQQGQVDLAAQHFLRLTTKFPNLAAGWNNLAHALATQGCATASRNAASCASAIDPKRFGGKIQSDSDGPRPIKCPVLDCPTPIR